MKGKYLARTNQFPEMDIVLQVPLCIKEISFLNLQYWLLCFQRREQKYIFSFSQYDPNWACESFSRRKWDMLYIQFPTGQFGNRTIITALTWIECGNKYKVLLCLLIKWPCPMGYEGGQIL